MAKINITVDIDWLGDEENGEESFDDTLKGEIIAGIVAKYTKNVDKDIIAEAESKIKQIDAETTEKINTEIDKKIADILNGFLERKINLYDRYGDVTRKNVAIIDLLKEKLDVFLTEKVDASGRTGGYDAKFNRLDYIIKNNITHDMEYRIEKAAKEIKKQLESHMQKQLEEKVGKNIVQLLKIDKM